MLFDDVKSYTAFKSSCRLSQSVTSLTPEYSLVSSVKLTSLDVDTYILVNIRNHNQEQERQGVHLSYKAGYWDYQIQSPTIISTSPQNCPIFSFIITDIIMYLHAL